MEVDALYGSDDYYDDLEPGCDCVALHEGGFRGLCYFCQKQGHVQRMCPHRSAGLPRVQAPQIGYSRGYDRGEYRPAARMGREDYDQARGGPERT